MGLLLLIDSKVLGVYPEFLKVYCNVSNYGGCFGISEWGLWQLEFQIL